MIATILSVLAIGFLLLLATVVILPACFGSPWHPLRPRTIAEIVEFAEIKPGETLYDLGSGEGRVLIAAAKKYEAVGVGLEIDPLKVWISHKLIHLAGVADRVTIRRKNFFDFDSRDADVIYLYLTHQALDRLFPNILKYLKPSTRIVSYRFCLRNMQPCKVNHKQNLFMYRLDKGREINNYS